MSALRAGSRTQQPAGGAQLPLLFEDALADSVGVCGLVPGATPGMSKTATPAVPKKPKGTPATLPSAAQTQKEADRIVAEGLHLRWASLQRRFALQGPLNFVDPPKEVEPVKSFKDLMPKYLRKVPEGWVVAAEGFVLGIDRPDALAISRVINAQKDDLGVYSCERTASGYRLVVEF